MLAGTLQATGVPLSWRVGELDTGGRSPHWDPGPAGRGPAAAVPRVSSAWFMPSSSPPATRGACETFFHVDNPSGSGRVNTLFPV